MDPGGGPVVDSMDNPISNPQSFNHPNFCSRKPSLKYQSASANTNPLIICRPAPAVIHGES